jgi:hypothetical protein
LNDVTWVEAGRALAERVIHEHDKPQDQLVLAFRLVCARRPDRGELAVLEQSLRKATLLYQESPDEARLYIRQGESKYDESIDPVQLAALANVCLAILNLDEALTRE